MARPGRKKTNIGPCREDGCFRDSLTRGYCYLHYGRRQKAGEFRTSDSARGGRGGERETLNPVSFAPGVANALALSTEAARVDALLALKQ